MGGGTGSGPTPAAASPKGSNNPKTREAAKTGQEAHRQKEAEYAKQGYDTEQPIKLENGQRVRKDAVKGDEVIIIKPDTPTGRAAGANRAELMKENGYNPTIDLYDPQNPAYQPGSSTYIGPKKK